ncbi:hypothetical protein TNCV_4593581 [Trichonephila clavipes]|uniref:Uncharacterized protein n=1 Tax=Trichonephila clavipes TaxID=2585209 RepID=A0A8X7BJ33_TRICX|nr:hypothetical protein TNCV_4593581 [Trichonephila clavipes]
MTIIYGRVDLNPHGWKTNPYAISITAFFKNVSSKWKAISGSPLPPILTIIYSPVNLCVVLSPARPLSTTPGSFLLYEQQKSFAGNFH